MKHKTVNRWIKYEEEKIVHAYTKNGIATKYTYFNPFSLKFYFIYEDKDIKKEIYDYIEERMFEFIQGEEYSIIKDCLIRQSELFNEDELSNEEFDDLLEQIKFFNGNRIVRLHFKYIYVPISVRTYDDE